MASFFMWPRLGFSRTFLLGLAAAAVSASAFAPATSRAIAQAFDPEAINSLLKQEAARTQAAPAAVTDPANPPQVPAVRVLEPVAPKPPPEELYLSKDPLPTFAPSTVDLTEEAAKSYLAIVESGGWPLVPVDAKLAPGVSGPAVAALKQRLSVSGDLDVAALPGDLYDTAVEAGVKHFQERLGLEQTGAVGTQTLRALNVTAIVRYQQLLASAKRLRESKFGFGPRYVVVNIPSANVEAIEDGKVVRRYIAVVGKPDHASPTVETKITSINLNPTWTLPASIVKNEIIPHMQANPGYLAKEHIRILDQSGAEVDPAAIDWARAESKTFLLRQDSGASNSLGTLRIDMPNKDAVYMHDTPAKGYFNSSVRFQSHGCVRVSKVQDLAAWLVENNSAPDPLAPAQSGWTTETIAAAIAIGTRLDIKLVRPVPVAWVYLTGYATPDHVVHFRSDVYNLDESAEETSSILPARVQPQAPAPAKASAQTQPSPNLRVE